MSIKFEGKPPFYLGIAEVASAHALDGSVVFRATISVPELRPKSVPVQFHRGDGRCQSIGRAVADFRENGRASKAAKRLKLSVPGTLGLSFCRGHVEVSGLRS